MPGGMGPAARFLHRPVHPFAKVLQALNPNRPPIDVALQTLSIVGRSQPARPPSVVAQQEDIATVQSRRRRIKHMRGLLPGEDPTLFTLPESLTPINLRKYWKEIGGQVDLINQGRMDEVDDEKFVKLVQAQFPGLDSLHAMELWSKVKRSLNPPSTPPETNQIHRDLTLKITRRNPDEDANDDISVDFADLMYRIQSHATVQVRAAMEQALQQPGGMSKAELETALKRIWDLPEATVRYVADPYKLYGHVLEDYMKTKPPAQDPENEDYADPYIEDAARAAESNASGIERYDWRLAPGVVLPAPANKDNADRPSVAFARGSRKAATCVLRLEHSIYHRDNWVDMAPKVEIMKLLYSSTPSSSTSPAPTSPSTQVASSSSSPSTSTSEARMGGIFMVNHRPMVEVFPQLRDREQLLRPFDIAGLDYRDWYVECKVQGQSPSSKRGILGASHQGAVRLALARAIAQVYPQSIEALGGADLLREDLRKRLPKTPGKKKHNKGKRWRRR